jgi:hypothetical protein
MTPASFASEKPETADHSVPGQPPRRRFWFLPRFSLAAALVALTLASIGLWYWYRVPYEIVTETKNSTTSEWALRGWGGERILHGPRRTFERGKLVRLESYREGVAHGPWEWRSASGELFLRAEYDRGKVVAIEPGPDCDKRLAELIVNGGIDSPPILTALLQPSRVAFVNTPLMDVIAILQDQHSVPMILDLRDETPKLRDEFQRVIRTPITLENRDDPLIVAFGRILQGQDLVCDYRYGVLWITEKDRAGLEPTGVSKLVPPRRSDLAAVWERATRVDFVETRTVNALPVLAQQADRRVRFDVTRMPPEFFEGRGPHGSVTLSLRGQPFKHVLGMVLDRAQCRARLDGEIIVIEPQQLPLPQ